MRNKSCPKCEASMAEGFVVDDKSGFPYVIGWFAGPPTKGWWGNLKLPGKPIPIATYRCTKCGFLEQYATGKGTE